MSYRTALGHEIGHPFEVAGPAQSWTERDRRWVGRYQDAFTVMTRLDNEVLRLQAEVQRLTHENQFMLRLIEKHAIGEN